MAIDFSTSTPNKLLSTFKTAIDQGHVTTWAYDKDGDFYHTASSGQWAKNGYLRPNVATSGHLKVTFLAHPNHTTTWTDMGVIQGRFIESMITHCHSLFTAATVSAQPASGDQTG